MFKALKDSKIIAINETDYFPLLNFDEMVEDTEHTVADFVQINGNGEFILKADLLAPTKEEQKQKRYQAYIVEVDPITAHIQRLRDDAEPDEEKIAELIAERAEKVAEIKARYPYPEESGAGDGEV